MSTPTERWQEVFKAQGRSYEPNELDPRLMSVSAMNPFDQHSTSPRKNMYATHLGQHLTVLGANERRILAGSEFEYAKYVFNVKAPVNLDIIKVIHRYPKGIGGDSIKANPETIVIYETHDASRTIGVMELKDFCSNHPYFGFRYKSAEGMQNIRPGGRLAKDEIVLQSPSVSEAGNYMYGVESNIAALTLPATAEDGIIASRSILKKFSYHTYERRVVEFGPDFVPMNIYGDAQNYKIAPDITEGVRADGLLMALRRFDERLSVFDQSPHALRNYYPDFDTLFYVPPGGRVIDIIVHHDPLSKQARTPEGMDVQMQKYARATQQFYQTIVDTLQKLQRERGAGNLKLTPEFNSLCVVALAMTDKTEVNRVSRTHRRAKLDDYRIEFVIEYTNVPDIGSKMTGTHGNKGVIVKIEEDDNMPIDDFGNRADFVVDPLAIVSRSIIGVPFEPYINAAGRDLIKRIRTRLNIPPKVTVELVQARDKDGGICKAFDEEVSEFYKLVSPDHMYAWYNPQVPQDKKLRHMTSLFNEGMYLHLPPNNSPETPDYLRAITERFPPDISPVTFINDDGVSVRSKEKVLVASSYYMQLDKTGDDWAALSSGRLQHFGVLARITSMDKYSSPVRNQPTRAHGESELRIYLSYTPQYVAAEIMDRNNNREVMEYMVREVLTADKPTDIENIVDREKIPYGNHRPLQIIKHIAMCHGYRFKYQPYVPPWSTPTQGS